jgi:hypothetical protein
VPAAKSLWWDFEEVPGRAYRLFLSAKRIDALMEEGG